MDLEQTIKVIREWATSEPLVEKAYIFGSRARNDYRKDSDLDVAVTIKPLYGESVLSAWFIEKQGLLARLSKLVPFEVQLENIENEGTPIIKEGVEESSILVYEKPKKHNKSLNWIGAKNAPPS